MRGSQGDCPRHIDTNDKRPTFQTLKTASTEFINAVYCSGLRFKKRTKSFLFLPDTLVFCFLLLSLEGVTAAAGDDRVISQNENLLLNDSSRGFHIGDSCRESCSQVISHSFCNQTSKICQCLASHPIVIEGVACVQSRSLHETCKYDQQCRDYDFASVCLKLIDEDQSVCSCKPGYYEDKEHNIPIKYRCFPDSGGSIPQTSVPTIVGLSICLTILALLLCFMFKLFSRSRWARSRGYADANANPPTITLEAVGGPSIDIEKQLYAPEELEPLTPCSSPSPNPGAVPSTSINITVASPNSSILKGSAVSLRRGSGNNNTNNATSFSGATSRRSSGNVSFSGGISSRRTSLQRNGLTVSGSDLKESNASSRRGSAFNNNNNRDSNTAPTSGSASRRSSSNVSLRSRSGSRKASLAAKNGLTADLIKALKELESGEGDIEQRITIVPNPRAKRRGSMASYAFPELHSRSVKTRQEPENLLILTRTRTDRHGRRHSVAVPLIPPPDGEKFEGGYHVERNPITGGATLVPPEAPFIRGRSSSERRRSVRDPSSPAPARPATTGTAALAARPANAGPGTSAANQLQPQASTKQSKKDLLSMSSHSSAWPSAPARPSSLVPTFSTRIRIRNISTSGMPTIGELHNTHLQEPRAVSFNRSKSLYVRRRRDSGLPGTAEAAPGRIGRIEKKRLVVVPVANVPNAGGRRHSYQSGAAGAGALARDMERLRVADVAGQAPGKAGISPKPSKKRRASTRRSSRSGFLHFLDLAIAN